MAFLGISVPVEVADLLSQLEVPGNRESKANFHITILNLGSGLEVEQLESAFSSGFTVCEKIQPFQVTVNTVSSFPAGEDGVPIIAPVDSPGLHKLRRLLKKEFDESGVEYSKKFPKFQPHVTLAYSDPETTMKDFSFVPITWTISEIVLWGGDQGANRVVAKFPLSMLKSALKVASRHLWKA